MNHLEKNLKEDQKEFIKNIKLILKTQKNVRTEMHVFTEEINKTALTSNDVKRIQSVDTIKTYVHRRHDIKYLLCKKNEFNCNK